VRAVDLDGTAFGQIAEVVRKEAAFDAVDAKFKSIWTIALGSGGDGVGARLGFATGVSGYGRNELAWGEIERGYFVDGELQVIALGGLGDAGFLDEAGGLGFAGQWELAAETDFLT